MKGIKSGNSLKFSNNNIKSEYSVKSRNLGTKGIKERPVGKEKKEKNKTTLKKREYKKKVEYKKKPNKKALSIAFAGGGARGFAHVGVISELQRRGFRIEEVAGTSMGAIIAAYYAFHLNIDRLLWFAQSLTKRKTASFLDVTVPHYSLIKGKKLRALLESWFGDALIEEAKIPLAIVASRLRDAKPVIFRKGEVVEALMASSAIPGLLPAVKIKDEYYVDGGISLNIPIKALRKRSTKKVAVEIPILCRRPRFEERPRISEILSTIYAIRQTQIQPKIPKKIIIISPNTGSLKTTLSFHKSKEFIANGISAARRALPKLLE